MAEILIVSVAHRDAKQLIAVLEADRHRVRHVEDGADALMFLRHNVPDMIFVDRLLSDMTGLLFLEELDGSPAGRESVFILMGELEESAAAAEALRRGAHDYLPRPIDPGEVRTLLRETLGGGDEDPGAEQVGFDVEAGCLTVRIPRRFTNASAKHLGRIIENGLVVPERGVIVDLTRTDYIASTGIGMLHLLAHHCEPLIGRLHLVGASPRIRRLLQIAGIFHFYRAATSMDDALAALA